MTSFWITGFIMGGIGSLHCIGMCGPLALSLPVADDQPVNRFAGSLFYNIGRVLTYGTLGLAAGMLGRVVSLFGMQQWLSVALGLSIIIMVMLPGISRRIGNGPSNSAFFVSVRRRIGQLYQQRNMTAVFFIGMLNGLLPCGLVYMALAASVTMGSAWQSALFMAGFGLGTLPVMWSLTFFGAFVNINVRMKLRKLYPYLLVLMACLLIIRGLGLGIPYLSPSMQGEGAANGIECHN